MLREERKEREREGERRKSIYGQIQSTLQALIIYSDLQPQANHSRRDEIERDGGGDRKREREREAAMSVLTVP